MDALVISPFHDLATGRSSTLARLVLTVLRREGFDVFALEGPDANREAFQALLVSRAKEGKKPFSLVLYAGHGLKECLIGQQNHNSEPLLDEDNIMMLAGAVIIAIACRSAKELGKNSIKKGVRSFVGFRGDVYLPEVMEDGRNFQGDFLRILLLLPLLAAKGYTVEHIVNDFKELSEQYMKKYREEKYLFYEDAHAWLNSNLKGITYHGPSDTTIAPQFVF